VFGHRLLDLCKSTSLRIVNGRADDDRNGAFTFISSQGASVIDYLLTKDCNFSQICNFTVHDLNEWSDHCPISFNLKCNLPRKIERISHDEFVCRYKWSDDCKNEFRAKLIAKLPVFNTLTNCIYVENKTSVNNLVTDFTSIIQDIAKPLFFKSHIVKKDASFCNLNNEKNKDWFDYECVQAKNTYLNALRKFNMTKSNIDREELCILKHNYKTTVKLKRSRNRASKIREIEMLRYSNPKDFWKYFKRNNNVKNNISIDDFFKYFSELGDDILQSKNIESESFVSGYDFDDLEQGEAILDKPFTVDEIIGAVKSLKRGKSPGKDFC
jgi:hypothetical protein